MNDLISRQAAIDSMWKIRGKLQMLDDTHKADRVMHGIYLAKKALEQLPPAQPEIIRCKDCKYRYENWRRVSVKWLPCMDIRTPSMWFCGSAERGEKDGRDN